MDVAQITDALGRVFNDEQVRIVFWNDPDREFIETLPDIALAGVEVLKLDEVGALEVKVRIEQDDPTGRYLLYSPAEEPDYEDDWLLDMRLYGRSFRADRASIILQELRLAHQHLRQHLAKRRKFFDNKERLHKLTSLVSPEDSELDLDCKMLAVVAKADQPELFNIVRTLFHSMTEGDAPDLEAIPPTWVQIERFELDEPFWMMIKTVFGYGEDTPTLKNLLIRLLVSDYAHHLVKELPGALLPSAGSFFDNKERLHKLTSLVSPEDSELDLDCKMLAVVAKADQPELFNIVRTLFHSMTEGDAPDLEAIPPTWAQIERFELDEPFWMMIKTVFGYGEDTPTLKNLLIRLLVSDYAHHLVKELPGALQHLQLPRSGAANAVVCLAQWRDSSSKSSSYDVLAVEVGSLLHMPDHLYGCEVEELLDVITFLDVEKCIVQGLLDRVTSMTESIDPNAIGSIVARRQAGHWVSSGSVPEAQRKARRAVYEALAVAAQFLHLRNAYEAGFDFPDMTAMYKGYETELFRFDQLYRHFCENADVAAAQGWDMLKPLREEIEACYCNGYLAKLALAWGKFVDAELPERWAIDGVRNQYQFFARHVGPWLDEADKRRAFVIISDAMRYEVAEELTACLNGTYRVQAELSSQLGVLPSYTALGMASLLPHSKLEYTEKGGVLVDGKPTASLEQRNEILSAAGGMAVKADQLLALKKEEGREFIVGKRLVYIYHDEIDARGDKAATEGDTFEAVGKTIQELADLVRYVVNNLNANYVVITADHGFLFTETAPSDPDKSRLEDKPDGTVMAKKRYLLGYDLPDHEQAWRGDTAMTAEAEGGLQFWVPKGNNRFHFTGGARFIHGGAMLQEIVVPVIKVKHIKDKASREKTQSTHVAVQVLGTTHKITAPKHRFNLLQMEPVAERAKAVTLKIAVYEGDEPVTSIEAVTFDSPSSNLDERQKSVILTLQDRPYDKRTPYRLVLRDADTGIEQASLAVIIDRAIIDDF